MTDAAVQDAPPSLTPFQVCEQAVEKWKAAYCPHGDFERETIMIASRVNSWISAKSVLAGVRDVFCAARTPEGPLPFEIIMVLGNDLAGRLLEEGMLVAQPRRGGTLS